MGDGGAVVNFIDLADHNGASPDAVRGTQFVAADGAWLVAISDKQVHEWVIWQRAVPGDRRRVSAGYVRRVPWMRFAGPDGREAAQAIAGVLDDLPATASLEVFRVAVRDRLRDVKTGLVFRGIMAVHEMARAARRDIERSEDDLLRD